MRREKDEAEAKHRNGSDGQGSGGFITSRGSGSEGLSGNTGTGLTGCDRFETLRVKH